MIYFQKAIIFPLSLHFAEFTEAPAFRSFFFSKYDLIPQISNSASLCLFEFQLHKVDTKLYYSICGEVLSVLSVTWIFTFLLCLYSTFGSLSSYQRHTNYYSFLSQPSAFWALMVFECIWMVLKCEYLYSHFPASMAKNTRVFKTNRKNDSCCTVWAFSLLAFLGCTEWRIVFMGCMYNL